MSNNKMYSTTERLSSKARAGFAGVTDGSGVLTAVVILSGILSAIFFWQNSQLVFTGVYPPIAIILGLAVGLVPAEGAFFGWKKIRSSKGDLTASQLAATTVGIVVSVACSIFSTFSLFVASFEYVPAEIAAYTNWFVFLALSAPVILQVALYAWYAINDRSTVENYERGKLGAMGFSAYIRAEQARMQAVIDGMDYALDAELERYGREVGAGEAGRLLHEGGEALLAMGQGATQQAPPQDMDMNTLVDLITNHEIDMKTFVGLVNPGIDKDTLEFLIQQKIDNSTGDQEIGEALADAVAQGVDELEIVVPSPNANGKAPKGPVYPLESDGPHGPGGGS